MNLQNKASEKDCGASDSLERKLRWACAREVCLQSEDDVPQAFATFSVTFCGSKTEQKRKEAEKKLN